MVEHTGIKNSSAVLTKWSMDWESYAFNAYHTSEWAYRAYIVHVVWYTSMDWHWHTCKSTVLLLTLYDRLLQYN